MKFFDHKNLEQADFRLLNFILLNPPSNKSKQLDYLSFAFRKIRLEFLNETVRIDCYKLFLMDKDGFFQFRGLI